MSSQRHKVRFFKVILERTLRDKELMVPRSFVKKYGKELPNPIILRVPHGPKWKVSWVKRDNDIWFKIGWERFAQHYSLSHGNFLVFSYEKGGPEFQVMIFDTSASEIDYWSKRCEDDAQKNNGHFEDAQKSSDIEILDDDNYDDDDDDDDDDDEEMSEGSLNRRKRKYNEDGPFQKRRKRDKTKINSGGASAAKDDTKLKAGIKRALERAEQFHSNEPFFIRQLFPSYLQNLLVIPTLFSKKYLPQLNGNATIWLDEDDSSLWSVNFKFNAGSNRTVFTTGWTQFVQKYNLQEGDVCVFQMIDHSKFHFKVKIYRAREQSTTDHHHFQDSGIPSKEG